MPPKRPSDGSSATTPKKQKKSREMILEQVIEHSNVVLALIPGIEHAIQLYLQAQDAQNAQKAKDLLSVVLCWRISCNRAQNPKLTWTSVERSMLDMRLPDDWPPFQSYNGDYESFSILQKANLSYLPAPSDFAQNWSQYQPNLDARLLCFRPPDARGLPLCTLHHVFRRYLLAVQRPLPRASDTAIAALKSAARLCASMGRSFSIKDNESNPMMRDAKENARTTEFDDCIRGILDKFDLFHTLKAKSDAHSGIVDGALLVMSIFISLREMKAEPGAGGDGYMQVVRSYDLAVKVLQEKAQQDSKVEAFLKQGAPMFLLCIMGPLLLVAGGFHDGNKVIVEPLGDVLLMFEDYTHERHERLARVLYALAKGIEELKELVIQTPPISSVFPPFTPRIYSSCTLYHPPEPDTQGHLTFTDKLEFPNCNRLLFSASLSILSSSESIPVLVKLVSGHYGEEVHHLLAKHDLAPTLHAYSGSEGAPKAYVMEYLPPSSWKTLFDYAVSPITSTSATAIQRSIDKVLDVLEKNGKVHGDLRSINIMVNISNTGEVVSVDDGSGSSRANIKVIDFDWAGDASKVYYPPLRNADIGDITWPGKPAGPIEQGHDRSLVRSWQISTLGKVV